MPAATDTELARVLIVTVHLEDTTAIAGRYERDGNRIEFRPLFPFDAGRVYHARLVLPETTIIAGFQVPGSPGSAATFVVRSTPSTDSVPENLLRMYLEFSDSMSRESGVEHIHLLDASGREVQHAFLPLDADFWNPAHTRYTVLFDPGRVKRGILPNEEMGRPLRAGRAYTLLVDSTWRDAHGRPLIRSFRQELVATPAVLTAIKLAEWKLATPNAGTRDSLVVTFPRSLDRGLIDRAIGVETARGESVSGSTAVGSGERRWAFVPTKAWGNNLIGSSYCRSSRMSRAIRSIIRSRSISSSASIPRALPRAIRCRSLRADRHPEERSDEGPLRVAGEPVPPRQHRSFASLRMTVRRAPPRRRASRPRR